MLAARHRRSARTRGRPRAACRSPTPAPRCGRSCAQRARAVRRPRRPTAASTRRPSTSTTAVQRPDGAAHDRTASWPAASTSTGRRTRRPRQARGRLRLTGTDAAAPRPARQGHRPAALPRRPARCPDSCRAGWCGRRRPPRPAATSTAAWRGRAGVVAVVRDGSLPRRRRRATSAPPTARPTRCAPPRAWDERRRCPTRTTSPASCAPGRTSTSTVVETAARRVTSAAPVAAPYSRPFLAHASIAPSCGLARWDGDAPARVEPQPGHLRRCARRSRGRSASTRPTRRASSTSRAPAATATTAPTTPPSTRCCWPAPCRDARCTCGGAAQDELTWAPFGSAMSVDVAAGARRRRPASSRWEYDVWSQGHTSRPGYAGIPGLLAAAHLARAAPTAGAGRPAARARAGSTRNAVPGVRPAGRAGSPGTGCRRSPLRTSSLRSLGAFTNVFAIESFMDELAARRRRRPAGVPARATSPTSAAGAVLEAAAERPAGAAPRRRGRRRHRPRLRPLQGQRRLVRRRRRGRGGHEVRRPRG